MRSTHNPDPWKFSAQAEGDSPKRRRHGRLRCEDLRCTVGNITDLSASGMKVCGKGKAVARVGEQIEIVIEYLDACMAVNAKTIRAEKVGFRKYVYGFEFVDLTEVQQTRLNALARVPPIRSLLPRARNSFSIN